ncbi:MAG: ferrochelatase [Jiangellaceae bacterium]|nr:ferrochelatase [Jiangellaceae bacterium]
MRRAPYDALLVLSFGGPERMEDVGPFLQNVTAGRDVPPQRLAEVTGHYLAAGGRSPINEHNSALVAALEQEFETRGLATPVYWGNRNWHPLLADELARMRDDGIGTAAVFLTSAYSSYSGCRQYREDLAAAAASVGPGAPRLDRLRHCFDHPGFVHANADAVVGALQQLSAERRSGVRLVFVTHSIPTAMAGTSGPAGDAYVTQHRVVAERVTAEVARRTGDRHGYDLVYCSRSGPPAVPWLEPDVNDHLGTLAATGVSAVVLAPIGFLSDHMEVMFDLDTEALGTARSVGLAAARAATAGTHPAFVAAIADLFVHRAAVGCPSRCCPNPRGPRPALCGASE